MSVIAENNKLGLVIPLKAFLARIGGEQALRKVFNKLTIKEKVTRANPRGLSVTVRHAYKLNRKEDQLIIPRVKGPIFMNVRTKTKCPLIDEIKNAQPTETRTLSMRNMMKEAVEFFEYQNAAISYVVGHIQQQQSQYGFGYAYLQMDTGMGKTRVACGVINKLNAPALVVVPTDAISSQWKEEFEIVYPKMRVEIYRNITKSSKKGAIEYTAANCDVVIIIINTFRAKTPEFTNGFGCVIFDEAHELHSSCNLEALWLAQTPAVIGLSATPLERPDGLDAYICLHLGDVISYKDIPDFDISAVQFKGAVRLLKYAGHPDHSQVITTDAGTTSAIMTILNFIQDPHRTALIVSEIKRLYLQHLDDDAANYGLGLNAQGKMRRHGVFVFAETREYLIVLRDALQEIVPEESIYAPEIEISVLRGGAAKTAVSDAKQAGSHIVLTTYGFSRRGISLPDMTSIVLATPRRNGLMQILGRILRRGSDESIIRQIVDIVDVKTNLNSQSSSRIKIYKEKNYPITAIKTSWDNYPAMGATKLYRTSEVLDDISSLECDYQDDTFDKLIAIALNKAK